MGVNASAETAPPVLFPCLLGVDERARLDELARHATGGRGVALRIEGERGIGKSSALDYVIDRITEFRVVRMRAVAAEQEIAYAGLHLLCGDLLDDLASVADIRAGSLSAAFGLTDEPRPDAAAVGSAVLELFDGLTRAQPMCLVIDDAQWLDRATAEVLSYVAARVDSRPLMILVAGDGIEQPGTPAGFPSMRLRPLSPSEARTRIASISAGPIDDVVTDRLLAECRGNLRRLAESLESFAGAEPAGGFGVPAMRPGHSCTHAPTRPCRSRTARLASQARRLLLAAAADMTGDVALLERLATEFGSSVEELTTAGLVATGDRITFTCPELRSITYYSAAAADRRLVHRMIGENTVGDPPRQAWHLGLAAPRPDNRLADELERHSAAARSRGGAPAHAAFLERAALLTGDPEKRYDRALTASTAMYDIGDLAAAQRLLAIAPPDPQDTTRSARQRWHRARIDTVIRPGAESARYLLESARQLRPLDPADAREAYLEALLAAMSAAKPADRSLLIVTATEARAVTAGGTGDPADQILHGLTIRILEGYAPSVEPLRAAVAAFDDQRLAPRSARWVGLAGLIAGDVWDSRAWHELARRHPVAGRGPGLEDLLMQISRRARSHDSEIAEAVAAAILHNAAGLYDQAVDAARTAVRTEHPCFTGWALAELVEAAVRAGNDGLAAEAATQLFRRTTPAGTDWARGVQATAEALLSDGPEAEDLYREAVQRLSRTGLLYRLARAELLFGEWLRRRNRRIDARTQLRSASEHFTELGAAAFVERARRELLATGEASRKRSYANRHELTPQEARVAALARDGSTNAEIAERLFVSPRTVEYHLYKAFAKLGVNSRAKLQRIQEL
ncbi:AAA family ATPase [Actinoplanes sp. NPDC049596]|uniref:helix-turn-helix transcriptional regulator n=1 Tax=unclassified Actinoplanes TaxID=2626549 RepID=UPI003413A49E